MTDSSYRGIAHASLPPPRLVLGDGTVEALKWLGLLFMTGDHVNKYLFAQKLPCLFELGRLAMPIFGFVLAYNLARSGALARRAHVRLIERLLLWGVAAFCPACGPNAMR